MWLWYRTSANRLHWSGGISPLTCNLPNVFWIYLYLMGGGVGREECRLALSCGFFAFSKQSGMKHWWRWDTSNRDKRYKQSYFLITWLVSLCSDAQLPNPDQTLDWEEISKIRLAKTREFIIFLLRQGAPLPARSIACAGSTSAPCCAWTSGILIP